MEQASNPIIKKTLKNPLVDYSVMFAARFFYSLLTSIEIYYFVAFLTDTAVFSLVFTAIILILTSLVDTFLTGF